MVQVDQLCPSMVMSRLERTSKTDVTTVYFIKYSSNKLPLRKTTYLF